MTAQTPRASRRLTLERARSIREDYASGVPVDEICRRHKVGVDTAYRAIDGGFAGLQPLPRRRDGIARSGPYRWVTSNRLSVVKRMWRAAEAQVADIEQRLRRAGQEPSERDARVMAVLARTLRELTHIELPSPPVEQAKADDDEPPADIDEFRRELARRLHAIIAARRQSAAGDPGPEMD
jgi:hypothetical protein